MFTGLFRRLKFSDAIPPPSPAQSITVIGDVHGRADLLGKALHDTQAQTVCVGDYIDRGERSADVLRLLQTRDDLICLIGNHEDMLLKFLDDPAQHGPRWLRYGGLQTLASFGVMGATETSAAKQLEEVRDRVLDAMGPTLIDWLRALPSSWQSGNVAVVHAGADPTLPIAEQDHQVLRWGHPEFETSQRRDGIWIAHGHTIVKNPTVKAGRINMDTGAYATGRLTMSHISADGVEFQTVT